jgi:hypothetical protein
MTDLERGILLVWVVDSYWRSTTEPAHDDEGQLALEGMMASAYPSLCSTYPQSSTAL